MAGQVLESYTGPSWALIIANFDSNEFGSVYSRHRSAAAAHKARHTLPRISFRRAYVAECRADGTYPHRVEAMDMPAHMSDYA